MLTILLSSPRVAPGLLTGEAWSVLHEAVLVLAPPGHPAVLALAAAGVTGTVAEAGTLVEAGTVGEAGTAAPESLAAFLSAAAAGADGPVVWLAPPGDEPGPDLLGRLTGPYQVVRGSHDLPGAHVLDLVAIMDRLRVSCPWDREQTHQSLLRYLLEEAYEAAETIEDGDLAALREEIGDVLLQVLFHARIAAERPRDEGGFTIDDVADTLAAKLIRRHPHVFGSVPATSAADVNANWEQIKQAERAEKARVTGPDTVAPPSVLDGVPFGQPALSLAAQLQRRAERAGISVPAAAAADAEIGDALMALVARARQAGLDPELELRAAARRFADAVREQV